jgi:hypothetical protein
MAAGGIAPKSNPVRIDIKLASQNRHLTQTDVPLLMGLARASAGLFRIETAAEFENSPASK